MQRSRLSESYVATHFGPLGINMSSAAGELTAEMIATGKPPLHAARTLDHLKLGSFRIGG